MRNVRACAACLATDVRMYVMSIGGLLHAYQLLSNLQNTNGLPQYLCWECAALVNKFKMFRQKCERASLLLQDFYSKQREVTEEDIRKIDRKQHNLTSPCLATYTDCLSFCNGLAAHFKSTAPSVDAATEACNGTFVKLEMADVEEGGTRHSESIVQYDVDIKTEDAPATEMAFVDFDNAHFSDNDAPVGSISPQNSSEQKLETPVVKVKGKILRDRVKKTAVEFKKAVTTALKHEKVSAVTVSKTLDFEATELLMTPEEVKEVYAKRIRSLKFKKARFQCLFCYNGYHDEKSYRKHSLKHDLSQGNYECDTCRMRFGSRKAIQRHIGCYHTRKYVCNLCSKVIYTRHSARNHCRAQCRCAPARLARKRKQGAPKVPKAKDFGMTQVILTQEQMMEVVRERRNAEGYASARLKCKLCYKIFNAQRPFGNHMLLHDPVSGPLECDVCKVRLRTRRKLYKHISCTHMRKYSCTACSHVCYNRATALKHYAWHQGVTYTCHICGVTSKKMSTHMSHLRIKHPSEHICGDCGEAFVSKMGLYHHAKKMHRTTADAGAPGPYCAACGVQFSSRAAWTKHVLISPKHERERAPLNACRKCGESFASAAELKRHGLAAHNRDTRPYAQKRNFPAACAQCNEMMPSASKYWQHFREQHPGKDFPLTRSSFICEHCGNWFKHKSTLEHHAQTHIDPEKRQHHCAECPKWFVKASSLAAHARSHAAGGQYPCDVCGRSFTYKHSLTNHFRTHTVEKPHSCERCGKTFAYDSNLKKHELAAHSDAPAPSTSHC